MAPQSHIFLLLCICGGAAFAFQDPRFVARRRALAREHKWAFLLTSTLLTILYVLTAIHIRLLMYAAFA
jgi:hypothetical protein